MLDQGLFRTHTPNKGTVLQQIPQPHMHIVFHITPQFKNTCEFALHPENRNYFVEELVITLKSVFCNVIKHMLVYGH
jgi:hypothetical protein